MVKVGEHITLDIIGTDKEYDPSIYERVINEIAKVAKVTNTTKVKFSPHQILFHTTHTKRNFILVEQAPKGSPRSIKLYGSTSILGLLTDVRETPCLALNDWHHINRLMLDAPLA